MQIVRTEKEMVQVGLTQWLSMLIPEAPLLNARLPVSGSTATLTPMEHQFQIFSYVTVNIPEHKVCNQRIVNAVWKSSNYYLIRK